jgi:hypothetical protein
MRLPVAALVLLLAACPGNGGKANNPTPPPDAATAEKPDDPVNPQLTDEQKAIVDRAVALTLDLAGKMQATGPDCDKLAATIDDWVATNGKEHLEVSEQIAGMPEGLVSERYSAKVRENGEVFKGMHSMVESCAENAAFAEAFNKLGQ